MDAKAEGALRCRYVTNNNPFLLLAPVKEEEVFLKPRLVVYHDVISEEEMETVKRLSKPKVRVLLLAYFEDFHVIDPFTFISVQECRNG